MAYFAFASLLALIPVALAQSQEWGQCGGTGWTGPTTCVAGTTCTYSNPWYSQCLPGGSGSSSSSSHSTTTSSSSTTSVSSTNPPPPSGSPMLNTIAQAAGKHYFGSATDNPELTDQAYVSGLSNKQMFGQITPGNAMKWDAIEPQQNVFTYSQGDQIANLAKANGQILRGHNLVWHQQLPSWVSNSGFSASQLTSVIQNHVTNEVTHYKGQIYAWDVVNEPFNDDGTFRSDVFYNTLGSSYISIALKAARAADPNAKLYINDYNIEQSGAKANAMMNLVKSLKAAGTPIDGIGFESHFIVGEIPSTLQANMEAFTALGIEIAVTELDIRMNLPSTAALLAQQEKDYQTVVAACNAVPKCIGVTIWDWTDKYSWVPNTFPGQGAACPWDQNLAKKPAFTGIVNGFA